MDIDDLKKKAEDALPDDETVEKLGEALTGHTPDAADVPVAKAEQWAKDHNKD
ncbi:antitoxin [Demequina sp.]|uniref:antitoxin n=1 Tax=Demequina sp. TaxID=2050685 RepID=UPI0025F27662|nr:antitoxin [Demequina sp.]